jgi:penicillin amidase
MKNILKKWYVRTILIVLIIAIIALPVGMWYVKRPWPQLSGNLSVPGLIAPVTVIRDERGVPQIYAQNEHDLFFAQAYVTAQDRIWEIYFHRAFISGRLSEIVGPGMFDTDRQMRIWGLHRIAEESYPKLSQDAKTILQAYADGVNAYVDTHRDSLPLEFTITGLKIEPYQPVDCLLWTNFMALHQAQNFSYELYRAQVVAKLGEKAAEDLLPPVLKEAPVIVPAGDYPWMTAAQDYAQKLGLPRAQTGSVSIVPPEVNNYAWLRNAGLVLPPVDAMTDLNIAWGSGAWAIDGKHTASGKPILASDAHLNLLVPSFWYEVGLHGGRFDVSGFSFPGVPLIPLGHNNRIAWGYTLMNPDVVDLYLEKLDNNEKPTKYLYKDQWYDLKDVKETIKIKGQADVNLDIKFTRHGPLINNMLQVTDKLQKDWPNTRNTGVWTSNQPIALSWPVFEGNTVIDSALKLNLAQNWDEFRAAVQSWETLSLDFVYADVDGNIGFQAAGKIPIRNPQHTGLVPVPGWTGEYEHLGYVPGDMLPGYLNPASGFIAIANNKVVSDDYPFSLTRDIYHEGYRIMRITSMINEKLNAGKLLTVEDMHTFQMDTYSLPAKQMEPYALAAIKPKNDAEVKALDYLKNWDLRFETDRIGASVYETWYQFMIKNTFSDEMIKNTVWGYQFPQKAVMALAQILPDANNAWFDDVTTPEHETRDDIVRRSFTNAMDWLNKNYGSDPSQWQWGKMHKVRIAHFALDSVPVLGQIFGTSIYSFPGDEFTVSLAYSANFAYDSTKNPSTGYWVWVAAQQRQIIDLSNWDAMLAITATGQNGNLFHPQREDQTPLWVAGKYYTVAFSRQAAEKSAVDTLILNPGK